MAKRDDANRKRDDFNHIRIRVTSKVLGVGSNSEVRLGYYQGGSPIAVKIIDIASNPQGARNELDRLRKINETLRTARRGLTRLYGFQIIKPLLYIAMDLGDGTLHDRMLDAKRRALPGIPAAEMIPLMGDIVEGLDALHEESIVHCDIKPTNVLILKGTSKRSYAIVADFGFIWPPFDPRLAAMNYRGGTYEYFAPEVFTADDPEHQFTIYSDQYSLALTYAFVRQGVHPLGNGTRDQIHARRLMGQFDLSGLGDEERMAVLRALDRDPLNRYPDCGAFVQALSSAVGVDLDLRQSGRLPAEPMMPMQEDVTFQFEADEALAPIAAPKPSASTMRWVGVAIAALIVLSIGAFFAFRGGDRSVATVPTTKEEPPPVSSPPRKTLPPVGPHPVVVKKAEPPAPPQAATLGARLAFAGQNWKVKRGLQHDPEILWSDDSRSAWVDPEGLHLRLGKQGDRWTCVELLSEAPVAAGDAELVYRLVGEDLDPQVVFSVALGEYAAYSNGRSFYQNRAIAFERSTWGHDGGMNAQFLAGEYQGPQASNFRRFDADAKRGKLVLHWEDGSAAGDYAEENNGSFQAVSQFAYPSTELIKPDSMRSRLRISLWLHEGKNPQRGREQEVIIQQLKFSTASN